MIGYTYSVIAKNPSYIVSYEFTSPLNTFSGKLSIIILCLENAMHLGHEVAPECQAELLDLRKQLMEDYSITPELVNKCSTEITRDCDGGLHRKG